MGSLTIIRVFWVCIGESKGIMGSVLRNHKGIMGFRV